jgi:hypothetical protein
MVDIGVRVSWKGWKVGSTFAERKGEAQPVTRRATYLYYLSFTTSLSRLFTPQFENSQPRLELKPARIFAPKMLLAYLATTYARLQ